VFVKIPGDILPLERGELFEDPLTAVLEAKQLGTVSGGGTQLSDVQADGWRQIVWCALDVELTLPPEEGLRVLREELVRLNAPRGTVLEYEWEGEMRVEPLYEDSPWPPGL
jgi:hypothetical protein